MNRLPSSQQLGRLEEVIGMRVRRAHKAYLEQLEAWRNFERIVNEQREEVAVLDADLQSVVQYMAQEGVTDDPQRLQLAVSRRHWTIYDREKAEYYLDVAESDLKQASDELDTLKRTWLKSVAREDKLGEQRAQAFSQERQAQEQRDELETADSLMTRTTS